MMKYIVPALGTVAALSLFAFSVKDTTTAIAVERPSYDETFQQLELFANVLASVRSDYVVDVENEALIEEALNGMLQSLDPHSSYMNADAFRSMQTTTSGEYGGLGMEVTTEEGFVKVVAPFDDTPASRAGIEPGDYLTEINGESLLGLSLTEAVEQMRGKPGEPITVTVVRSGEDDQMELTMVREVIERKPVSAEVKDGLAYLRIAQFNEKTESSLKEGIEKVTKELGGRVPGVILDLRRNPGGLLDQSIKVSSVFLDGGEVVSTRGRRPNDVENYNAEKKELLKGVPLVVIIDNASASASEIVAGAIQDRKRGLVIGKTSFGKGSVQSILPLRGGRDGALRLTTQRYYTPSGRSIQGSGIEPDLFISAQLKDDEAEEFHESDLPNAIINELEEAAKADDEEEIIVDYPPEGFDVEDGDYQLQRAIEILKDGSYAKLLNAAG
ncbi:S41 family peptidase [Fretibacter rubidus]|uniref:S41 family peptidase n=1 Tax=Fretibacter rubidus TaxID=570162 RepID=UPI00352AF588